MSSVRTNSQYLALALTLLQTAAVAWLFSFFSAGSAQHGLSCHTCFVSASMFLYALTQFAVRKRRCGENTVFILLFISHLAFNLSAIVRHPPRISLSAGSYFLTTLKVRLDIIMNIANCVCSAAYTTTVNCAVIDGPIFTDVFGLLAYSAGILGRLFRKTYDVFVSSAMFGFFFLGFYAVGLQFVLRVVFLFLRISVVDPSVLAAVGHLLLMCFSNCLFFYLTGFLDGLLVYNCSFIGLSDVALPRADSIYEQRHYFRRLVLAHEGAKSVRDASSLRSIEQYFIAEINGLDAVLDSIIGMRARLDNCQYVTVPQVHKNFSKKIMTYHFLDILRSSIAYRVGIYFLPIRGSVASDNVAMILRFLAGLRRNDSLSRAANAVVAVMPSILEKAASAEQVCNIDVGADCLRKLFEKLEGKM